MFTNLNIFEKYSFDFFINLNFWIILLISLGLFWLINIKINKSYILILFNIIILLFIPSLGIEQVFLLVLYFITIYYIGKQLNYGKINNQIFRKFVVIIGISSCIVILAIFKYALIQNLFVGVFNFKITYPRNFYAVIGVSYFSFKLIHFLIESYKKKFNNLNLMIYLNYMLLFINFSSGPINRYADYHRQFNPGDNRFTKKQFFTGIARIIDGLFRKFVLSIIVLKYSITNFTENIYNVSFPEIIIGLYAYSLYIYFDFSGYTNMAIGSANLFGINLPENFNKPFFRKNIQQLWANWHMSLTQWLTDYIYWPLSRKLRNFEYFKKHPIFLSNVSIFVTFIVCGLWHGDGINFIIWGAYHGIGLVILNIYQAQKRRIKNDNLRKYFRSKLSEKIGIFVTFNFFVYGIALFALNIEQLNNILNIIFMK